MNNTSNTICGIFAFSKRTFDVLPDTRGLEYYKRDNHEAIVSKKLWNKTQAKLEEKSKEIEQGIYRQSSSHFLYGRIYCGECGEQMRRITYGRNRTLRKVWKCQGRTKGSGCMNDVINENELFEHICNEQGGAYSGPLEIKPEDFTDIEKSRYLVREGS